MWGYCSALQRTARSILPSQNRNRQGSDQQEERDTEENNTPIPGILKGGYNRQLRLPATCTKSGSPFLFIIKKV